MLLSVSSTVTATLKQGASGTHAGQGYLEFKSEKDAKNAVDLMDGCDLGGSLIHLELVSFILRMVYVVNTYVLH